MEKKQTAEPETQRVSGSFSPEQVCLLYRLIVALKQQEDPRPVIKDPVYGDLLRVVGAMLKRSGALPLAPQEAEPEETEISFTREEVSMLAYVLKTLLWSGDPSGVRHRRAFRPLAKKVSDLKQHATSESPPQEGVRRAASG